MCAQQKCSETITLYDKILETLSLKNQEEGKECRLIAYIQNLLEVLAKCNE